MDLVNVANKVKQLRHQQKLTIDQLAARTGLSKGYISRLENFRTGASLRALNLIAAALGVEMIDYTGLSAEENAALAADGSNMMYSFTYTTLSGKETTIAFYPYSTRRCLVTINGKGEFYVLIDRVEKMISDTGKLLRGEEIDSFAKN